MASPVPPIPILDNLRARLRNRLEQKYNITYDGPSGTNTAPDEFIAENRAEEFTLDQLPYCLGGATEAVVRLNAIQVVIARDHVKSGKLKPQLTLMFGEEYTYPLGYAVDSYLESARRAQNAMIPYLGKVLGKSFPSSMADLAAGAAKGKWSIPEPLHTLILAYWDEHGKALKLYRDLSQHYALVSSDARLTQTADGRVLLYLTLPNNPEERSVRDLSFSDPEVHAYPFCRRNLHGLFKFICEVVYLLTQIIGGTNAVRYMLMKPREPVRVGEEAGVAITPPTEVVEILGRAAAVLPKLCEERWGPIPLVD
jgi:hypothetical protein